MTRSRVSIVAAMVVAVAPASAHAWGGAGHRIVADIAQLRMTPKAVRAARSLLAASEQGAPGESLADAAVWADSYRDSSATARALTSSWHYVNLEVGAENPTQACPADTTLPARPTTTGRGACLLTKMDDFIRAIGDPNLPDRERGLALRFLLHLVGDGHQPLHAAQSCHDAGGNAERVITVEGEITSLHGFWDTTVIRPLGRNPEAVAKALNTRISRDDAKAWAGANTANWIAETHGLAVKVAYANGSPPSCPPSRDLIRLSPSYEAQAREIAALQLERAGVRLAAVLNALLG